MPEITRISPGPRMSQAVVHSGVAYLAGQVGNPGEDVGQQTATILSEIDRLLETCGTGKANLLTAQIWLADIDTGFAPMNAVWEAWVTEGHTPARWTGEAKLAGPEYLVEIIVTAAV